MLFLKCKYYPFRDKGAKGLSRSMRVGPNGSKSGRGFYEACLVKCHQHRLKVARKLSSDPLVPGTPLSGRVMTHGRYEKERGGQQPPRDRSFDREIYLLADYQLQTSVALPGLLPRKGNKSISLGPQTVC